VTRPSSHVELVNLVTKFGDLDVAFMPVGTGGYDDLSQNLVQYDLGGLIAPSPRSRMSFARRNLRIARGTGRPFPRSAPCSRASRRRSERLSAAFAVAPGSCLPPAVLEAALDTEAVPSRGTSSAARRRRSCRALSRGERRPVRRPVNGRCRSGRFRPPPSVERRAPRRRGRAPPAGKPLRNKILVMAAILETSPAFATSSSPGRCTGPAGAPHGGARDARRRRALVGWCSTRRSLARARDGRRHRGSGPAG